MCAHRRHQPNSNEVEDEENKSTKKEISSTGFLGDVDETNEDGWPVRRDDEHKLPLVDRQRSSDTNETVYHTARDSKLSVNSNLYLKMGETAADDHVIIVNEEKEHFPHDSPNTERKRETKEKEDELIQESTKFNIVDDDRKEMTNQIGNHSTPDGVPSNPLVQAQISTASSRSAPWLTAEQLENFASREKHKKARRYYEKQMDLVKNYREDKEFVKKFTEDEDEVKREQGRESVKRSDDVLAKLSLALNVCLLAVKCVAAGLSGSLVVIGTVVDSATDITTGLVIFLTNRAIIKRDLYKYPRGRTRLQPIALIIISVIMGACSVQVISKSIESMARGTVDLDVEIPTIVIMIVTIVTKFVLMIVCYLYRSPTCSVLAQDHRNDTISNTVAIICAYLANKYWSYLDPIAAIVVSCYILITWLRTGNEHVKTLSGKAAKPDFINRIVKICLDHKPPLKQIDTVYAYHYGTKYLVEIDVVLDKNLSLKDAHDIAEPLQRKIEYLPDVERAFVHIDYETEHRPDYEHKRV